MTFHDDEHRINNTGWIRNGDETEGWNEKQNHRENAERFSIYIFLHQKWKQCLEFALAKLRRICKYFGWCLQFKQSCLRATLSYFCLQEQGRKINTMRRVFFEKCIKKSSALSHTKNGEVSLQIEFATLPPKNHDLFVKQERIGNWNNKENAATG